MSKLQEAAVEQAAVAEYPVLLTLEEMRALRGERGAIAAGAYHSARAKLNAVLEDPLGEDLHAPLENRGGQMPALGRG